MFPNHYIQSSFYSGFMKNLGWETEVVNYNGQSVYVYCKKLSVFGSILKIPRAIYPLPFEEIDRIAKKRKALFVKIEPNIIREEVFSNFPVPSGPKIYNLSEIGYKPDSPIAPTKTIFVDLSPLPEKIEGKCKTDVRTCLHRAENENLIAIESKDLNEFYSLFETLARERGFYHPFSNQMRHLWEAFGDSAKIILVYDKPQKEHPRPLAGCLILVHEGVAYYKYAASLPEGRKRGASYLSLWNAMLLAKKAGCRWIDLEGITDERYRDTYKYKGITHFKRSWGGTEVTYLGSFSKSYSTVYALLSKITVK